MAFKLPSRVLETFDDLGTGTVTLDGAVSGYKTFASELSNGDTCFYFMVGGSDYEFGRGTYSAGTLARTSVRGSSNADAAVNWAAGTKTVGIAPLGLSDLDATALTAYRSLFGFLASEITSTAVASLVATNVDAAITELASIIQGGKVTIADDAKADITPDYVGGIIILTGINIQSATPTPRIGAAYFDTGASLLAQSFIAASGFAVLDSTVAGTTGTDGNVTIGRNTGVVQIENRAGASATFHYVILKGN